jgi:transposase-like protein
MTTDKKRVRRTHSLELKAQILAQCEVTGASVAKVAMLHGINANVVHGWRRLARDRAGATGATGAPNDTSNSPAYRQANSSGRDTVCIIDRRLT